jgi:hypothetical protein
MPSQSDWRNCQKCQGLFFNGFPIKGVCPKDQGQHTQHNPNSAFDFNLPRDIPGTDHAQPNWRNCQKCQGLFFNGFPIKGVCPKGGQHEQHDPDHAFDFVLPHDVAGTKPRQGNWRNCQKCQGLFFNGFSPAGVCPADHLQHTQHDPQHAFDFVLPIVPRPMALRFHFSELQTGLDVAMIGDGFTGLNLVKISFGFETPNTGGPAHHSFRTSEANADDNGHFEKTIEMPTDGFNIQGRAADDFTDVFADSPTLRPRVE